MVLTDKRQIVSGWPALLHVLGRLGGAWRLFGRLGRAVPVPAGQFTYDCVARARRRIAPAPESTCPLLPPHLRTRMSD